MNDGVSSSNEDGAGIRTIHAGVAGRVRLEVAGLRGSPSLKRYIESHPPPEIRQITASALTGRVLAFFEPGTSLHSVTAAIARLLAQKTAEDRHPRPAEWELLEPEQVFRQLASRPAGLTEVEARQRLEEAGANRIAAIPGRSRAEILLGQLQSLPVALLGGSALLSVFTGGLFDAVVIVAVIGLNAAIGFGTEAYAEEAINALADSREGKGTVVRGGLAREVPLAEIVCGDLIELHEGVTVPADARLVTGDALTVSEAILTGESVPVEKHSGPLLAQPFDGHPNLVFRGTLVTGGTARAVVVATGHGTEVGRIQASIEAANRPRTPLQRQLDILGRQLVALSLGASAAVFVTGILRGQGALPTLKIAVSLAIAAVPEGLPALATTTLAIGIGRLRRQGVLIRRLPAVEGLSAIQLICFDKTGTLTLNRMSVTQIVTPSGNWKIADERIGWADEGDANGAVAAVRRLLEICSLCSDAQLDEEQLIGSSTEAALVRTAAAAGIDVAALRASRPRIGAAKRTERRRYMVTTHEAPGGRRLVAVKGDPDRVLALSTDVERGGRRRKLTAAMRERIAGENRRLAEAGLRVLGVAHQLKGEAGAESLVWDGLIAMADPVRPDAAAIIHRFHRAGIATLMITGDQPATAMAIAREVGLQESPEHGRAHLDRLRDSMPGLERAIDVHVFSRVTPSQKLTIVRSLQQAGLIVAMTGDGVNDAPSLRTADVGIALAGGTEAARQSADVVLLGDELQGIVAAIDNGRATYDNIQRAIEYLLATNLSEIALTLAATATGIAPPLTPFQLLWINLVTDVLPALGLALEPPAGDLMERPPRDPRDPVISPAARLKMGRDSAVMTATTLAAQLYARARHGTAPVAGAVGFASLACAQLLHAVHRRAPRAAASPADRDYLAGALALSAAMQAAALFVPGLRRMVGGPIDLLDAAVVIASGAASLACSNAQDRRGIAADAR